MDEKVLNQSFTKFPRLWDRLPTISRRRSDDASVFLECMVVDTAAASMYVMLLLWLPHSPTQNFG